jgi:hypothetical protein
MVVTPGPWLYEFYSFSTVTFATWSHEGTRNQLSGMRAGRAARASRRNVYPRHHKQRTENCVEQDAHAVRSPGHSVSPSSKRKYLFIRDI